LEKLPANYVLPLLDQLVVRLQSKPYRASRLIAWIRELLKRHAAYLISQQDLSQSTFATLYQLVESRLSTHSKFMELDGRLEMIASQVEMNKRRMAAQERQTFEPLAVFNDEQ